MKVKLTIFFYCIAGILSAQDTPNNPNGQDDINTASQNNQRSANTQSDSEEIKNIISFNPFTLARNIIAVEYLRIINDDYNIEAGLGISYAMDRIATNGNEYDINDIISWSDKYSNIITLNDLTYSGKFYGRSLYKTLSIRRCIDWRKVSYIELNTRFYSNKFKVDTIKQVDFPDYCKTCVIIGNKNIKVNYSFINLIAGWHVIKSVNKFKISHDIYFGIGVRIVTYDTFTRENGNSEYVRISHKINTFAPACVLGYKFGLGF